MLNLQRSLVSQPQIFNIPEPVSDFDRPDTAAQLKGQQLISEGKVACLILAGGQGTRLGASQPKALFEITPVRKKTLLQLLCEKTAAASAAYKVPLQIGVMTSPLNHSAIQTYLKENGYFGLAAAQVHLFIQDTAPFLNDEGNWFSDASGQIASGPDGNGHALRKLMETGIGKLWKEQGIESVIVLPIDNPLADPFDAALCGYHALTNQEATLKAIERRDPSEKVGVIVLHDGKICVQEYSELPENFDAPLAHIGLFCFSLSLIERMENIELPWHLARKKYADQMIWKFERFLFDVLAYSERTGILVYPREDVYAPLKNLEGPHSLKTVQEAMAAFDLRLISPLTQIPTSIFELDPAFYYLTAELLTDLKAQWEGKALPLSDYISLR